MIFRLGTKTSLESNDKKTRDLNTKNRQGREKGVERGIGVGGRTKSSKGGKRGIREQRGGGTKREGGGS